jgi:LPS sulfotransferase NodH
MSLPATRLPKIDAAEVDAAVAEARAIFADIQDGPVPAVPDYRKAYTICMTPRSGSTHLTDVMARTGVFGHPQEYLHRLEPTALAAHAGRYGACTWDAYLAALGTATATDNGVFGVKADLNMLLPPIADGSFDRTLRHGRFIYITRADVLMQAISLTKAQRSGAWTDQVSPIAKTEFNFAAIYRNVQRLTEMMGRWEAFFALNGITPLRLTYERIDSELADVLPELAVFLNVSVPTPVAIKPKSYQRNAESSTWRDRFLAALNPA